ncbi:uncharacterized protein UV8b_07740 [Ustilaginoidea virens]|uniref:Uncharacterized protein n=1 Tax=Ustilaginoidea virens TaxID=1159556 RepID=A0A063BSF6_USTVR|nr:uncharacterized protein UV8b_07740 [Ustilaginoidea virens]QUC23499.1 hypothetical protein UV8b_07740 [Ustilaginoidea virens]GAO15856.1 hypothetical protein UVI_02051620 [Ustilaginoidea virens]
MEGTTAQHEQEWLHAAHTDPVFVHPIGYKHITEVVKLELLQRTFWTSLTRWVEARRKVLPSGEILGGWSRADMYGMMDWYRLCFNMTSRYEDAVAAHKDGIWRTVILTSPWWDWPEFAYLYVKTVRDANGVPQRDAAGRIRRETRDPYDDRLEDDFMDLWERVANTRPLGKHPDGTVVLPVDRKPSAASGAGPAAMAKASAASRVARATTPQAAR